MNAAVTQKTQETLGRVIKKPPLTEKLLSKPPFRYLQDIFSEVIRTTGFMKGLYSEAELKSDNVKDKDAKMVFLQKAIDVVMLASGEPLSTKPARIVAGHEPEKTNELLQAIGRCCINKLSSDEAVKRVLAGDRADPRSKPRSQDKENRESRDRNQAGEEKKELKERSTSRDGKYSDSHRPARDREDRRAEKDRHRDHDRSKDRDRDHNRTRDRDRMKDHDGSKERDRDRNKTKDRDRTKDRDKSKDHNRTKDYDRTKDGVHGRKEEESDSKERERDKRRDKEKDSRRRRDGDKEVERKREEDCPREPENAKELEQGPERGRKVTSVQHRGLEDTWNEPLTHQVIRNKPADQEQAEMVSPVRLPRPTSAKGQRQRPKPGNQDGSDSDAGAEMPLAGKQTNLENGDVTEAFQPQTSQGTRRTPRPSSARPAPPRVKRQESYAELLPLERLGSGKSSAAVIVEGAGLSDQEGDEQFVVEESVGPSLETEPAVEVQDDDSHGGLVKKILETKKDYEKTPLSPALKEKDQRPLSEAHRKERDLVSREMDRLGASVQTVCRSTLPLGRIIDYLQEDVDSMQVELQAWQRENQEYAQALLQEQRVTDSTVEPLKAELAQLEQLIRDQQDKIYAIKCNIVWNEAKIRKMMLVTNSSTHT